MGPKIINNIKHCTRLYIEIVEVAILCGQSLRGIDKQLPYIEELKLTSLDVKYLTGAQGFRGEVAPMNDDT